jgi:cytidylate kinase
MSHELLPSDVTITNSRVVAIDGGTATGKGRLIDELSQLLRLKGVPAIHLSTGSLYRAVAYAALEAVVGKVPKKRELSEAELSLRALELVRAMDAATYLKEAQKRQVEMHGGVVWMDGQPASEDEQLKGPGVGTGSSIVSRQLPVRRFVDVIARRQVNEFDGFVLVDGRDIGKGVVPEAPLKLLLTVAPEIAAKRSTEHSIEEIIARDRRDRDKPHGALPHPDNPGYEVVVLSTDHHTPESIRDEVYALMRQVFPSLPTI